MLSQKKTGDTLDVIGPLGQGFPDAGEGRPLWMVAGGTGLAPFLFILRKRPAHRPILFYGARSAGDLV